MMRFELRTSTPRGVRRHHAIWWRECRRAGRRRAEGAALVFCPHTTAGSHHQRERRPGCRASTLVDGLERHRPARRRLAAREGNSDGHSRARSWDRACSVPVEDGRLALGTWQGIYFCEFDGPRSCDTSP